VTLYLVSFAALRFQATANIRCSFPYVDTASDVDVSVCISLTCTDGSDFMGERLIVQFARGSRRNENFTPNERVPPRPRRTPYRMRIANLPVETSWQVRHPNSWISPVPR
jgi:hypothetical protein